MITIIVVCLCACLLPLAAFVAARNFSWLRGRIELDEKLLARLQELARRSLETLDVPVGALLLYDGEIIGEGCNTVLQDRPAGGHAELNAIMHAIGSMGYEQFSALDRRKLSLLTTFEPCIMCAGACVNYNIPTVYFMQAKNISELMAERKSYARYLFRRMRIRNRGEQHALFELHPRYPGKIAH